MDNPHTILGLAVPTNEPDVAFNDLLARAECKVFIQLSETLD